MDLTLQTDCEPLTLARSMGLALCMVSLISDSIVVQVACVGVSILIFIYMVCSVHFLCTDILIMNSVLPYYHV